MHLVNMLFMEQIVEIFLHEMERDGHKQEMNVKPKDIHTELAQKFQVHTYLMEEVVSVLLDLMELDAAGFESSDMQETDSLEVTKICDNNGNFCAIHHGAGGRAVEGV
ncbi:hypothetical protein ACJX0J_039438 [Zea mays]